MKQSKTSKMVPPVSCSIGGLSLQHITPPSFSGIAALAAGQKKARAHLTEADAPLFGVAKNVKHEVLQLLRQATTGDSMSALLIGPPGVGKSAAVKAAEVALAEEGHQVITVRLFGSQFNDDRACMRELFSQLVKKMCKGEGSEYRKVTRNGTLAVWVNKLAQLLRESTRAGFLIFVVLEGFEAFCHSKSKQALLYNLFDLMHLCDVRLACLGITTKIDATDHLEKRIKSRFQLRKLFLRAPASLSELNEIILGVLTTGVSLFDQIIKTTLESKECRNSWTLYFDTGFSVRDFIHASVRAVLKSKNLQDLPEALIAAMHGLEASIDSEAGIADLLGGLTIADHMVLVGLVRLHRKGFRPKSFASVFREITSFEKSSQGQVLRHERAIYWRSFKKLRALGIISITESSSAESLPLAYCPCRMNTLDLYVSFFYDSTQTIKQNIKSIDSNPLDSLPSAILEWATRGDSIDAVQE